MPSQAPIPSIAAERLPNGPELWRLILAEMPRGAVIAGGAVRDYLLGFEPKDIDVFMAIPPVSSEPIPFELDADADWDAIAAHDPRHGLMRIDNTHQRFEEYTAVSNIVCVSSGKLLGWPVDAIDLDDFEGGEKLIDQFDFAITRCWFGGGEVIHDTPEAKRDRDNRTITLLSDAREARSLARYERLKERWGDEWALVREILTKEKPHGQ